MDCAATYQDVYDLLERTPAASVAWADGIVAARLSMHAVVRFIETMSGDPDSPLRASEDDILGEEIRKLHLARGSSSGSRASDSRYTMKLRGVLSPSEQTRVLRIVDGFCAPSFEISRRFSRNGHAVMNAVRRLLTGYCTSKIPKGASVVEVGPDVAHWMLSPSPSVWEGNRVEAYSAARPNVTPRDTVRMYWADLAASIVETRDVFYSSDVRVKAAIFRKARERVFPNVKVPSSGVCGEYMLSYDSNYDIKFSDMPVAMALSGARAWYGTMVRAKGLTSLTRLQEGKLPLMGVTYRVDWEKERIDFRHPECSAFGYSHNVYEYMKYEERNGYVWSSPECDYVYSKGPETTDELLFFSVVRVPKLHKMREPRFTENPRQGLMKLTSLWGIGDEKDGLFRSFEEVSFHVDALNFSKVLEKRRALDHKGDIGVSLSLVRSTNVRFYVHGTPVGANERIAARLAPATALVIESIVHQQRLSDNNRFSAAMYEFDLSLASNSWFSKLLTSILDYRVITGAVISPVVRIWQEIRGRMVDAVLSPLRGVKVGFQHVGAHVELPVSDNGVLGTYMRPMQRSECLCGEIAELQAGLLYAPEDKKEMLNQYLIDLEARNTCQLCVLPDILNASTDSSSSSDDVFSEIGSVDTDATELIEEASDLVKVAANEFIELEVFLMDANLRECRVDYANIIRSGPVNEFNVAAATTGRTRHAFLQFASGRCVKVFGHKATFSAMYSNSLDRVLNVQSRGNVMFASVPDGYYYSCNRMEVWNAPSLIGSVEYALDYGKALVERKDYQVTLGVPGAGKTFQMMQDIAREWKSSKRLNFLVVAVTNESVKAAVGYGIKFGIDEAVMENCAMTLDKYLMHKKHPADLVCIDEFPMVHIAKVDAAVAITGARKVRLYGDARQIPYDPFCKEFKVQHATLGTSVPERNIIFLAKTHRLRRDVCAMWIDQYPAIYPCDCCDVDNKHKVSLEYERVTDISHLQHDATVRYHTYLRDDREELKSALAMRGTKEELRARKVGGLATVHEDQGSTHTHVISVRLMADYDKNASKLNPSLFNRDRYVLTDTTRHTHSFKYISVSEETDLVMKRIDMSKHVDRLKAVDEKRGYADVAICDMLS